jgi:hypothetical protein
MHPVTYGSVLARAADLGGSLETKPHAVRSTSGSFSRFGPVVKLSNNNAQRQRDENHDQHCKSAPAPQVVNGFRNFTVGGFRRGE